MSWPVENPTQRHQGDREEGGRVVYLTTPCTTLEAFVKNKVSTPATRYPNVDTRFHLLKLQTSVARIIVSMKRDMGRSMNVTNVIAA